ncbi:MAG: UDP-glucose--hexose-1-phosphate uridylyltransferase [Bacteroidetes bacterium]|nr:UDP-glucose--hexose-1-phosphate uridylyltransferase [Bacteroidota bacterium]MBU1680014.1 UDP-glucose--hexose-1-phosphate uridylyltransferase [Bacteroidota bacterium]
MKLDEISKYPHRRKNILTGEWVLVSPTRTQRPWLGKVENLTSKNLPTYESECYLCPGNKRAGGNKNGDYVSTYSFVNDFSALVLESSLEKFSDQDLLIAEAEQGICKVICFSPQHNLSLAEMEIEDIENVIDLWQNEFIEMSKNEKINYIQIFENKGEIMGASNPHPHGQIWAQNSIPVEIEKEMRNLLKYYRINNNTLLTDYLKLELQNQERIVYENEHFAVVVPFWAIWPFETILISKYHFSNLSFMNSEVKQAFADALKNILVKYDNLFHMSFPYSAGIHQSPSDNNEHPEWHFHMHFYPPLLRSATIKKFMVGYEMLANPQRDILPEYTADVLRNLSSKHYLKK